MFILFLIKAYLVIGVLIAGIAMIKLKEEIYIVFGDFHIAIKIISFLTFVIFYPVYIYVYIINGNKGDRES